METSKIYIPCYSRVEFGSLEEAVNYVQNEYGGLWGHICDIVIYNVRFRDCLRKEGIEGVVRMLSEEAPAIVLDNEAIDCLERRAKRGIANYDIQCLPKDGPIYIDGYRFDGLADIKVQVEISGTPNQLAGAAGRELHLQRDHRRRTDCCSEGDGAIGRTIPFSAFLSKYSAAPSYFWTVPHWLC